MVRLTFYVTAWAPEKITALMEGIEKCRRRDRTARADSATSLIGVEYLLEPDVLVEIEATAVLD